MKETPIIFNTQMVRAILDLKKTQTRRPIKPQPVRLIGTPPNEWPKEYPELCLFGKKGDRLWVRETWAIHPRFKTILYRADGEAFEDAKGYGLWKPSWSPSIHMFKKYARIWLEITNIRVERLQDMNYYDWVADFCPFHNEQERALVTFNGTKNQREMAQKFWDSMYGKKYPWSSNPWVWVIEFKNLS